MSDHRLTLTHGHGEIHPSHEGVQNGSTDPKNTVYRLGVCTCVPVRICAFQKKGPILFVNTDC